MVRHRCHRRPTELEHPTKRKTAEDPEQHQSEQHREDDHRRHGEGHEQQATVLGHQAEHPGVDAGPVDLERAHRIVERRAVDGEVVDADDVIAAEGRFRGSHRRGGYTVDRIESHADQVLVAFGEEAVVGPVAHVDQAVDRPRFGRAGPNLIDPEAHHLRDVVLADHRSGEHHGRRLGHRAADGYRDQRTRLDAGLRRCVLRREGHRWRVSSSGGGAADAAPAPIAAHIDTVQATPSRAVRRCRRAIPVRLTNPGQCPPSVRPCSAE